MGSWLERFLDSLAVEPLRTFALLRLPLIGLIAALSPGHTVHWLGGAFGALLVLYAAIAVGWLYLVMQSPVRAWFGWASTAMDVMFVVALCVVSGVATAPLMAIYFLLPISVVFLSSPAMTGGIGIGSAAMYLGSWLIYAVRERDVDLPAIVYVQTGCLLWLATALTALSFCLKRRALQIDSLLRVRRHLISESMKVEDSRGRALSTHLHDGPLQNLLAARLDLGELRTDPTDEGFDRLDSAVLASIADLRRAVSELNPQILAQLGLSAAVRELVSHHERCWQTTIKADVDDVGQPGCQAFVFRAARELLNNVEQHAHARTARVTLQRHGDIIMLRVTDDGVGFAPEVLPQCASEGRIGLGSLIVALEAMGGSMTVESSVGAGTEITLAVPGDPADSAPQQPNSATAVVRV